MDARVAFCWLVIKAIKVLYISSSGVFKVNKDQLQTYRQQDFLLYEFITGSGDTRNTNNGQK